MRRLSGFSLMEMMVVLLIVAVVAAASAPMINKKMMSNASERTPWVWTGNDGNIAFNLAGNNNSTVTIGEVNPPAGITPSLFIGGDNPVKLALTGDNNEVLGFVTGNGNMALGNLNGGALDGRQNCTIWGAGATVSGNNSTVIGAGATASGYDSTVIGAGATASGNDSTAVGNGALANRERAIAIGSEATAPAFGAIAIGTRLNSDQVKTTASGEGAIAIGRSANALKGNSIAIGHYALAGNNENNSNNSLAIGYSAKAQGLSSVAIGDYAMANEKYQIVLGQDLSNAYTDNKLVTVYIPGNLVVDGNVYLGRNANSKVYQRMQYDDGGNWNRMINLHVKNGNARARKGDSNSSSDTYMIYENNIPLSSDRRLKNVGKPFVAGLEEIKKLKVFNFTYKKDKTNTPQVGVMAQDLQKIFPNAVTKGDDGYLLIRKEEMFYAMVNAIKELASNFDVQGKKIKELEKQNADLIKRIEALEKKVK